MSSVESERSLSGSRSPRCRPIQMSSGKFSKLVKLFNSPLPSWPSRIGDIPIRFGMNWCSSTFSLGWSVEVAEPSRGSCWMLMPSGSKILSTLSFSWGPATGDDSVAFELAAAAAAAAARVILCSSRAAVNKRMATIRRNEDDNRNKAKISSKKQTL